MLKSGGSDRLESPLDNAWFFEKCLFTWLNPVMRLGAKRPLEDSDIYNLPNDHRGRNVHRLVKETWNSLLQTYGKDAKFSSVLFRAFGFYYLGAIICMLIYVFVTVVLPYLVQGILDYVANGEVDLGGLKNGYAIAILLFLCSVMATIVMNLSFYISTRISIYMRSATMLMVFEKSLKLSNAAKGKHSTGEIVTLMSVDSERLVQALIIGVWILIGPIMITIAMAELAIEVGWASVASIGVLLLLTWFQGWVGKKVGQTRRELVKFTDERVKVMNETLQGVRVVKLYAWEDPSQRRIQALRISEILKVAKYQLLKICFTVSFKHYFLTAYQFYDCYN